MNTKGQREQDQSDEKFLSDVREWMNETSRAGQTWRDDEPVTVTVPEYDPELDPNVVQRTMADGSTQYRYLGCPEWWTR